MESGGNNENTTKECFAEASESLHYSSNRWCQISQFRKHSSSRSERSIMDQYSLINLGLRRALFRLDQMMDSPYIMTAQPRESTRRNGFAIEENGQMSSVFTRAGCIAISNRC